MHSFFGKSLASVTGKGLPWVPEDIFFLSILMVLVNPASPRTISIDKKKISSGTQGRKGLNLLKHQAWCLLKINLRQNFFKTSLKILSIIDHCIPVALT